MPTSIHNAAAAIGKKLGLAHLIHNMEKAGALLPEGDVHDILGAVASVETYAKDAGVSVRYVDRLPRAKFGEYVASRLGFPLKTAVVATLGYTYIRKYHNEQGEIPEELEWAETEGPGHCVLIMAADTTRITFFDPDPALKKDNQVAGFPPGVVFMDTQAFELHHTNHPLATEALIVETFMAPRKEAEAPRTAETQQRLKVD